MAAEIMLARQQQLDLRITLRLQGGVRRRVCLGQKLPLQHDHEIARPRRIQGLPGLGEQLLQQRQRFRMPALVAQCNETCRTAIDVGHGGPCLECTIVTSPHT
ncbi:MAG: hypothetical protein RSD99_22790, partial [Janthinobacterium sp.]